jgi:hypothetical protein
MTVTINFNVHRTRRAKNQIDSLFKCWSVGLPLIRTSDLSFQIPCCNDEDGFELADALQACEAMESGIIVKTLSVTKMIEAIDDNNDREKRILHPFEALLLFLQQPGICCRCPAILTCVSTHCLNFIHGVLHMAQRKGRWNELCKAFGVNDISWNQIRKIASSEEKSFQRSLAFLLRLYFLSVSILKWDMDKWVDLTLLHEDVVIGRSKSNIADLKQWMCSL